MWIPVVVSLLFSKGFGDYGYVKNVNLRVAVDVTQHERAYQRIAVLVACTYVVWMVPYPIASCFVLVCTAVNIFKFWIALSMVAPVVSTRRVAVVPSVIVGFDDFARANWIRV